MGHFRLLEVEGSGYRDLMEHFQVSAHRERPGRNQLELFIGVIGLTASLKGLKNSFRLTSSAAKIAAKPTVLSLVEQTDVLNVWFWKTDACPVLYRMYEVV